MKMLVDENQLMTIKEAANYRGRTHQAIRDLIRRKKLNTVEIMGRTYLIKEEVYSFVPQPLGRPRKNKAKAASHKAA